jgi:hypothetical protein
MKYENLEEFRLDAEGSAHAVGWVVSVMHGSINCVVYKHAFL